jgi:cell wall-associated NlpC family hydrolase
MGRDGPDEFDCSGFVMWVHRELGYRMDRPKVNNFVGFTEVTNPLPGDVVSGPHHVGICVGPNRMIHASGFQGRGVVLEDWSFMAWVRFYRYW